MNEFVPIFVVGIIVLGIYKVIELFVRRRERLMLVEKLEGEAFAEFIRNGGIPSTEPRKTGLRFGVLHFASAMLGLGLGLVVTFSISSTFFLEDFHQYWHIRQLCEGGCVLLFTGLALVISFIVEYKLTHKKEN